MYVSLYYIMFYLSFSRGEKALFNMIDICLNPDSDIVGMYNSSCCIV